MSRCTKRHKCAWLDTSGLHLSPQDLHFTIQAIFLSVALSSPYPFSSTLNQTTALFISPLTPGRSLNTPMLTPNASPTNADAPPPPSPPPSSHLHTPSVLVLGLASSPRSCAYGDVLGNRDGRRKVWYESLTQRRAPFADAHALRIEGSRYRRRDRV